MDLSPIAREINSRRRAGNPIVRLTQSQSFDTGMREIAGVPLRIDADQDATVIAWDGEGRKVAAWNLDDCRFADGTVEPFLRPQDQVDILMESGAPRQIDGPESAPMHYPSLPTMDEATDATSEAAAAEEGEDGTED